MEIKKSKKADLEGQRGTNLLLGYILGLGLVFSAFEFTTHEFSEPVIMQYVSTTQMEEEVPPMTQPIFTVQLPPPAEVPAVAEILEIVENDEDIKEEVIQTSEQTTEAIQGPTGPPAPMGPPTEVAKVGPAPPAPIEENDEQEIFDAVERMPEFPGGEGALLAYLSKNIKYPAVAQENNIQGRVLVQFVVNKDGSIVDCRIVKSSVDKSCDKEALRVVSSMPKWKPGQNNGKPVRVRFTVPVMFRLT